MVCREVSQKGAGGGAAEVVAVFREGSIEIQDGSESMEGPPPVALTARVWDAYNSVSVTLMASVRAGRCQFADADR